jgi:hypothetical protein
MIDGGVVVDAERIVDGDDLQLLVRKLRSWRYSEPMRQ